MTIINDPINQLYLDLIDSNWNNIIMVYEYFRDKKPIIEYEVRTKKIYSYHPQEYINALTLRTREHTRKKYEEAVKNNQFLLFIRDHKNKKLKSYIFDLPN